MLNSLITLPQDPIYGMQAIYKADSRADKTNFSIGTCLDEQGKLLRFRAVIEAEKRLFEKKLSKEYLPIGGYQPYLDEAQKLVLGNWNSSDFFSMQTVGGTGALFAAASLLVREGISEIFIPEPSWPNHKQLFTAAGLKVTSYPYYNRATITLELEKMVEAIAKMPKGSPIVLQASCHNPTGVDPTAADWKILSRQIKEKGLLPLFDLAYLGLGGGIDEDTESIRTFAADGHEMFIATTFAKSMGLYNDRLGLLSVRTNSANMSAISSHLRSIARTCYSSPPANGAFIFHEVALDPSLYKSWLDELSTTSRRLDSQRKMLFDALKKEACKIPYEHILGTKGLFCLFDISHEGVEKLREDHGIYIALDGRIAVSAITEHNVALLAKGMSKL